MPALTPSNAMPFAGKVLAFEDDSPLPGAHVYVVRDGLNYGTVSDLDGLYYMDQAAPGEDVYVRFVGRETEVFAVPREPQQLYTHRLRSNAYLPEVEIFGEKPDDDGAIVDDSETPPRNGSIGIFALLAYGAALLLLTEDNRS